MMGWISMQEMKIKWRVCRALKTFCLGKEQEQDTPKECCVGQVLGVGVTFWRENKSGIALAENLKNRWELRSTKRTWSLHE